MSEAILTDNENPYSTPDASLDVGHDDEAYQPKIFAFVDLRELLIKTIRNTINATNIIAPSKAESTKSFFKKKYNTKDANIIIGQLSL